MFQHWIVMIQYLDIKMMPSFILQSYKLRKQD